MPGWILTKRTSENAKLGLGCFASIHPKSTCPAACPHKDRGCYARSGNLAQQWKRTDPDHEPTTRAGRAQTWTEYLEAIRRLPPMPLRLATAGDLPGDAQRIDPRRLADLVRACQRAEAPAWTYTHHDPTDPSNARAILTANRPGFVVNLSADTIQQADRFAALDLAPVALVVSRSFDATKTPAGRRLIVCPAGTAGITCTNCDLCRRHDRRSIIVFRAHGPARILEATIRESEALEK